MRSGQNGSPSTRSKRSSTGFSNEAILRSELRRLFLWLKDRGITAVVTGERGDRTITKYGLEEYVADCVITLDHRVTNQIATRRLRIVKYRGSVHGTDEYPFLISSDGISVLPITSMSLTHMASNERIATGIPRLDTMLGAKGFYRGSSILVSGQAGTGKTSIAATFVNAACKRGEKCLFFIFEESESQFIRNMKSIGMDFEPWVKKGLLKFHAVRPTAYSLEMHLSMMLKLIDEFKPKVIAVDPISNLYPIGDDIQVRSMLMRLIDYAKSLQITGLFTNLSNDIGAERLCTRTDRDACLVPDGRVAHPQERRGERGTEPGLLHHQVPGDGALEPAPRVRPL